MHDDSTDNDDCGYTQEQQRQAEEAGLSPLAVDWQDYELWSAELAFDANAPF